MLSIFKWQKINFQTSQFNHFAFCCKSTTSSSHDVVKVFFFTHPTNPIWVWVQRIPSFFLYYCKQKYYTHFCMAWGFMLQNQGNMPWWLSLSIFRSACGIEFEDRVVVTGGQADSSGVVGTVQSGSTVQVYTLEGPQDLLYSLQQPRHYRGIGVTLHTLHSKDDSIYYLPLNLGSSL